MFGLLVCVLFVISIVNKSYAVVSTVHLKNNIISILYCNVDSMYLERKKPRS